METLSRGRLARQWRDYLEEDWQDNGDYLEEDWQDNGDYLEEDWQDNGETI